MITAQDITSALDKYMKRVDTRFLKGEEHDGVVDLTLDDADIRVHLNQSVVRTITIPEREGRLDRKTLFDKYVQPKLVEFVTEFRNKAKRVVVTVVPVIRRDPNRETAKGRDTAFHLGASYLRQPSGDFEFVIEMKFGTFNI